MTTITTYKGFNKAIATWQAWSAQFSAEGQGASSATGVGCVAGSYGYESRAMATDTNAIVLVHRYAGGLIKHIRASKVGDNNIKSGVWYSLDSEGEFYEAGVV